MRFVMLLLVFIFMIGFNSLQCQDITDSQLVNTDSQLNPGDVERLDDDATGKDKTIVPARTLTPPGKCLCHRANKGPRPCKCNGKSSQRKQTLERLCKMNKYPQQKCMMVFRDQIEKNKGKIVSIPI